MVSSSLKHSTLCESDLRDCEGMVNSVCEVSRPMIAGNGWKTEGVWVSHMPLQALYLV